MLKKLIFLGAAAVIATIGITSLVSAGSSTWKLSIFNASGRALRSQVVEVTPGGTASFTFPVTADAAYLTTAKGDHLGNLTGQTLSASVGIVATDGTTFANYPGCTNSSDSPMVGLYFQTNAPGGFNPSSYWWSSDRRSLTSLVAAPTTLTRALTAGQWTNYNGQTDPAGFNAAAANVTSWGVSFGGDCFYANGVGTPAGSAVFSLTPLP